MEGTHKFGKGATGQNHYFGPKSTAWPGGRGEELRGQEGLEDGVGPFEYLVKLLV